VRKIGGTKELLIYLSLCLFLVGCASKGPGKISLDPTSQKFLDMIAYIILPVEEKIFREMPPEDRGEFIKDFWARRDPDPSTPVNEFRERHYARLAMANKAFRAGTPGSKTDRGRIYILLGPPTNIIKKAMGDVPYEQGKFFTANPLESGTLTEMPTEIWVYDNYPELFSGPLHLTFVDYHGTGDYKLTTNVSITAFSGAAPTWDTPDLAKYHLVGEIEMDEKSLGELGIFDYDVAVNVVKRADGSFAALSITIPYIRLGFRKEGEEYICDLTISAEVKDDQSRLVAKKEEPLSQGFSEKEIKELIRDKAQISKEWELPLALGKNFVYISVVDKIKEKRLRKLLQVKGS
jgi:GWxTD domain-containing protein